ncbi:Methionyl-tRNA formyltransferase, partial [Frankliniella fusca]
MNWTELVGVHQSPRLFPPREETNGATFDFDEYSLEDNFTFADIAAELEDDGSRDKVFFIAPEKLPESDFQNLFEKLNQDQRDYIMHVADHFEKTPDKQLLHFLTGGAGVGKSLTITT